MADSQTNVVSLLVDAARRTPDRTAIVMPPTEGAAKRITFAELWRRVDSFGRGLTDAGLRHGDRVVIMIPMSIDLYVTLLAVLKIGAAAVFVDPWISRRQIAAFAAFAEPTGFIGVGKAHLLRWMDARLRRIPITVTTGRRWCGLAARHQFQQLLDQQGDGRVSDVELDAPALITFTTGSSGAPKGANRTHGYLLAQHAALQAEFSYDDTDVDLTMFPVFALNNLAKGITTIVPPIDFRQVAQADGASILQQIADESVTTITASPPLVDRLCDRLLVKGLPKPLRRILVGGAPVSDDQLRRWRKRLPGVEIVVVYGSTEAEPVAHITAAERLAVAGHRGFCVGRPTPLLDTKVVRIVDGGIELRGDGWQAWEVAPGEIGELAVSGDHVGRDYFKNPDAVVGNKITEAEGRVWHRMGDTGYFDENGLFWLVGRVHSTIRRQNGLIHPQLVEQAAAGDDVERVAAIGLDDAELGQRLLVIAQGKYTDQEVATAIAARLSRHSITFDEIVLTTSPLPVDPRHNSKIDYAVLRETLTAQDAQRRFARWPSADLRAVKDQ